MTFPTLNGQYTIKSLITDVLEISKKTISIYNGHRWSGGSGKVHSPPVSKQNVEVVRSFI
ncbi:hypothetical protein ACDZ29_13315 [Peribacillus sp. RS7]|uniref:hypothetical protein n=1 Tax=unclassified Peribacillus TaxID=2675266 RepID=UPI0025A2C676|nr:hypothetical protein [Peribacillus sp. ACCC06369]MDM5356968.1 hypothetical protein [Peribacillus sp. ACCC06369]